jgi:hypothetical protein
MDGAVSLGGSPFLLGVVVASASVADFVTSSILRSAILGSISESFSGVNLALQVKHP